MQNSDSEARGERSITAGVYEHYKGGLYLVLGIGAHTETSELMAVYVALTGAHLPGPRLRVRPLVQFAEEVMWPDGSSRPRFIFRGDSE